MIDAHAHVFRDAAAPPPAAVGGAAYALPDVDADDHRRHLDALGCTAGVLVQPSALGVHDHDVLLAALAHDPARLRGVACIGHDASDATLERMAAGGIVATRIQDGYPGGVPVESIAEVGRLAAGLGWHVEVWTDLRRHASWIVDAVAALDAPVVIDHLGSLPSDLGVDAPPTRLLLDLLALDHVWVTLSGAERLLPPGADPRASGVLASHESALADRVQACIDTAPGRVLWGSDWPHVGLVDPPSVARLLDRWHRWVPDPVLRHRIATDNTALRYGFDAGTTLGAPPPP